MADLSKGMIYGFLLLTAAGAASHFWLTQQFDEAGAESKRALKKLKSIASMREDINALESEMKNDLWLDATAGGKGRFTEFFHDSATKAGMGSEKPSVEKARDTTPRGVTAFVDSTHEMNWKNIGKRGSRVKGFTREQIAMFLWNLEFSPLLRVTELSIERAKDSDDLWVPKVFVTERKPASAASKG